MARLTLPPGTRVKTAPPALRFTFRIAAAIYSIPFRQVLVVYLMQLRQSVRRARANFRPV